MKNKSWPGQTYREVPINDLILAAFYSIEKGSAVGFPLLLKKCFALFPERFCFPEYSEWPDSRKLGRSLRFLREEGFVKGGPEKGFSLSQKGEKRASEVVKGLRQKRLKI